MRNRKVHVASFVIWLLAVACNHGPSVDLAESYGTFEGRVVLIDSMNVSSSHQSNCFVTIPGTDFSAWSDDNGIWRIPNVPQGIHSLMFEKPGYGKWILFEQVCAGSGVRKIEQVRLRRTAETAPVLLGATFDATQDTLLVTFEPWDFGPEYSHPRFVLDLDSSVDPDDTHTATGKLWFVQKVMKFTHNWKTLAGQTAYISATFINPNSDYYYNPATLRGYASSRGPRSNTISIVLP